MLHHVPLLVCVLLIASSVQAWPGRRDEDHWFCHELDCPEYTVIRSLDDDLELREYGSSLWVSTNVTHSDYDYALRMAFIRLYQYIEGDNQQGWRMAMTAPVRTKVTMAPGRGGGAQNTYTVSFYLPDEYQSGGRRPPAPNRDSLFLETSTTSRFWVKAYAGFASGSRVLQTALDVMSRLDQTGEAYHTSSFYTASYDPPFRIFYRHNELWIKALHRTLVSSAKRRGQAGHTASKATAAKGAAAN